MKFDFIWAISMSMIDEIGMPKTKKIKTFQSKKKKNMKFLKITLFQYINFLNTILSFTNSTKTMYK